MNPRTSYSSTRDSGVEAHPLQHPPTYSQLYGILDLRRVLLDVVVIVLEVLNVVFCLFVGFEPLLCEEEDGNPAVKCDEGLMIRSIILDEDREAVASPQCYALGLIPFCKQNPNLRIERCVSLWRNALQPDSIFGTPSKKYKASAASHSFEDRQITNNVSQWVMEAITLAPAGMLSVSSPLDLDGQPVPDLCAKMFQKTVQRDVAWQAA
ncbi:hypothetical protein BDP55DRAFT_768058 [Colletotrichum godetiae]|uniref:Uncharacterized protein n=1 Tax=Colletotrichum godetiae TaxID=1209918 RepID=A0AAJ0EWH7_9PEZI|nr:uncharacterized protein BDP55DRAFT_768058 [Colletotrichum godetiae]KAK1676373.1 hypothetical protein BDP55DRAFT_768058 [Colletotrichum godetiae]